MDPRDRIAVEIQQLSKVIRKKQLLQPLDYQLEQGKILALCGGNGAGKSTLIRLIVGAIRPTTGHVSIHGFTKDRHKRDYLLQFGYMPDDLTLNQELTARETLHFFAAIKKVSPSRCTEVLDEVGLLDKANEKLGHFSKGMTQRLLLAQALLARPPVLILDEPTNGLDPHWIRQFCNLMLRAKDNGQTVIFSTHDLYVAELIADEVLFLNRGQAISSGPISKYRDAGLYRTFQQLYFAAEGH